MALHSFVSSVALATVVVVSSVASLVGHANATTVVEDFSGVLGGVAVSGSFTLDVSGSTASGGTGTFTGFGLTNVPMVLITNTTPGDEGFPSVGFRANDGTDYFGYDQNYPIDANGLLFQVDTAAPVWGAYDLLGIANANNGNTGFTGKVGGTEYYNYTGAINLTATPLPAALPLFAGGVGMIGVIARRRKRKAFAAV
jgi:hypothetical protein